MIQLCNKFRLIQDFKRVKLHVKEGSYYYIMYSAGFLGSNTKRIKMCIIKKDHLEFCKNMNYLIPFPIDSHVIISAIKKDFIESNKITESLHPITRNDRLILQSKSCSIYYHKLKNGGYYYIFYLEKDEDFGIFINNEIIGIVKDNYFENFSNELIEEHPFINAQHEHPISFDWRCIDDILEDDVELNHLLF